MLSEMRFPFSNLTYLFGVIDLYWRQILSQGCCMGVVEPYKALLFFRPWPVLISLRCLWLSFGFFKLKI